MSDSSVLVLSSSNDHPGKPLDPIRDDLHFQQLLRTSVRKGRLDTANQLKFGSAQNKGLHSYLMITDHLTGDLVELSWKFVDEANQRQYIPPATFVLACTKLVYMTGMIAEDDMFRNNPRNVKSRVRFLLGEHNQPLSSQELSLFDPSELPTATNFKKVHKTLFLVSKIKIENDGSEDYPVLYTYLCFPDDINEEGTMIDCVDFIKIDQISMKDLPVNANLPEPVIVEPKFDDINFKDGTDD